MGDPETARIVAEAVAELQTEIAELRAKVAHMEQYTALLAARSGHPDGDLPVRRQSRG